uniref:Uncharacterized protein n=1 Tax=Panagrolaimus sp. PS1159 TaxID=55785 RepID=A0AC35FMA2_9BILA
MRGCMSDIIHYNRSIVRDYPGCYSVRLRDLFVSSDRYAFEPHDQVELCPCHKQYCNGSTKTTQTTPYFLISFTSAFLLLLSYLNNNYNFLCCSKIYHSYPRLSPSSSPSFKSHHLLSSSKNAKIFNDLESRHRRISQKMVLEIGVS